MSVPIHVTSIRAGPYAEREPASPTPRSHATRGRPPDFQIGTDLCVLRFPGLRFLCGRFRGAIPRRPIPRGPTTSLSRRSKPREFEAMSAVFARAIFPGQQCAKSGSPMLEGRVRVGHETCTPERLAKPAPRAIAASIRVVAPKSTACRVQPSDCSREVRHVRPNSSAREATASSDDSPRASL